jgi:hypothetical protein
MWCDPRELANWAFLDWMLNFREEVIQSTFKIRQAGFADCIDACQGFDQTAQYADRPLD